MWEVFREAIVLIERVRGENFEKFEHPNVDASLTNMITMFRNDFR